MGGGFTVSGDCSLGGLLKELVELLDELPLMIGDRVSTADLSAWKRRSRVVSDRRVSVHCWVLRQHPPGVSLVRGLRDSNRFLCAGGRWVGAGVVGLVFENCIVDASICFLQCS